MKRVSATISGRVQGVTYRASARKKALKIGVSGWVRNLPTGDVALVAEGSPGQLERLLDWCRSGPIFARVDAVEATWSGATGEFETFEVLR